jgi:putative addiction module component (TIGR02574 family)
MTEEANELLKKAMALPVNDRAELAGSLLDTLDETMDEDVEASWQNEIALRIKELDSGKAKTVPWTEVRSRLTAKLTSSVVSLRSERGNARGTTCPQD